MGTPATRTDPFGTALGFLLGVAVGLAVAVPAIPAGTGLTVSGSELGPIGSLLLVAALSVLLLPLGILALYMLFYGFE